MEDSRIIDLYWNRDQRAIHETAGKYGRLLERVAWNILRSRGDAEECVNDTYFRAWNAIPPTRPAAFRTWLGAITRNLSLDRWKSAQAEKRGGGAEILLGELTDCVPAPGGPQEALEDQALADLLSAFLRGLSQEGRGMFLQRYWYGESVADIAAAWGCGQGKVKSSLFRTRKALRRYLEEREVVL